MQVLTVADEVVPAVYSLSIKERFPKVKLVLGCGDLPYYYLEFIVTMLSVPCLYVRGNHDKPEVQDNEVVTEARGCTLIDNKVYNHSGLLLAGLGGSIRYSSDGDEQYTETEMLMRSWRLVPRLLFNKQRHGRYLDILLTHAPPLGIHNGDDLPHRGFKTFLTFMKRFEPSYLFHGHIHRSYGFTSTHETVYQKTRVINTAGYRLMEIEAGTSAQEA